MKAIGILLVLVGFTFAAEFRHLRSTSSPSGLSCREQANSAHHATGAFVPKCRKSGLFEVEQFHPSSGYSWCVDPLTGETIEGTEQPPTSLSFDCSKYALTCRTERQMAMDAMGGRVLI